MLLRSHGGGGACAPSFSSETVWFDDFERTTDPSAKATPPGECEAERPGGQPRQQASPLQLTTHTPELQM